MPTTTKGFPYPSSSDNPNIPADFQALAEAIDTELDSYSLTDANTTYHLEGATNASGADLQLIGSDSVTDTIEFRQGSGLVISWDEGNQRMTFSAGADLQAIEALAGTSGFLKKTAADTWELDTASYSTTSHTHTLDNLSDVVITSGTLASGQVLKYDGTNWINGSDATGAGGSGNSFTIIVPSSGSNVEAESSTDTLTLSGGTGISVTGDASTDTITIAVSGAYITGSSPTITTPTLTLSTTSSTSDGRIAWDTTYHHGYIGDGTNLTLVPTFRVNTTAKTGAYTLAAADANTLVQMNGAFAFTVPLNSVVPYPIGTQINLVALTTGASVTQSVGVTVNATPGKNFRAAYSSATLVKIGTDSWLLLGDLSA
jgi:hypothetical protein